MARKKVEAEKEIVELSEEECPYELPEGWKWERLGDINKFKTKNITPQNFSEEIFELYSVPNFIYDYPEILKGEEIGSSKQIVDKDDVLLCKINPNINRVWTVSQYTNNRMIASGEWIVFRNSEINSRMIKWYFTSPYFRTLMMSNVSGVGGSLTRAKPKLVANYLLPIPPKETQQKIVDIIESLFAKLDVAQEKVEQVLAESENRRAAILYKAFSGKLTEKWREENGVPFDTWKNDNIKSLCNSLKYGTSSKSVSDGDIPVIRMGNLQNGEIDWNNLVYSDNEEDIIKYKLEKYDVLFNRTNSAELVGKTSIYRGERPAVYAGYLIKLDYKKEIINGEFLNYYLNSPVAKEYCNKVKTDGVNQSNINAQKIGAFEIRVPILLEQKEIVRLLDKFLSVEDKVKTTCQNTLETIATMRKSILAKAFRRELIS